MGTSHTIASCPALGCSYRELREEGTSTHLSQDLVQGLQNELHEAALGAACWGLFGELAAVGGYKERYEEQELLQTRPLLSPGHLLPPNTPLGSIHGHGSRMCSKKSQSRLCSRLWDSKEPRGFTPSRSLTQPFSDITPSQDN